MVVPCACPCACPWSCTWSCAVRRAPCVAGRRGRAASQRVHSAMPSPVLAQTRIIRGFGIVRASASSILRHVHVEVREQVDLREHDEIGLAEHHRVLERLVLALGDREGDDARGLPEVVDRRADEVAHVLEEEQVGALQVEPVEPVVHEARVEVAARARRDADATGCPPCAAAPRRGPSRGRRSWPPAAAAAERARRRLEQRRLARARRAHQVDRHDAVRARSARGCGARCGRSRRAGACCTSTGTSSGSPQPQVSHMACSPSRSAHPSDTLMPRAPTPARWPPPPPDSRTPPPMHEYSHRHVAAPHGRGARAAPRRAPRRARRGPHRRRRGRRTRPARDGLGAGAGRGASPTAPSCGSSRSRRCGSADCAAPRWRTDGPLRCEACDVGAVLDGGDDLLLDRLEIERDE